MSYSFSAVAETSVPSIAYDSSSLILADKPRHVFKTGTYENGASYNIVMLVNGDEMALYTAAEMIRAINHESLKYRAPDEYARMLSYGRFNGSGGFMVGITDEQNRLIGMSGIEAMDDESDHGSGPVVLHDGVKDNYKQVHYKALGLLPEARGKGHMDELYQVRNELFVMTGRPFAVMKTNTPQVIARAMEHGWVNQSEQLQNGWDLVYEFDAAKNGKIVDVLTITREAMMAHLANNKTQMLMPENLCIVGYAPQNAHKPTLH